MSLDPTTRIDWQPIETAPKTDVLILTDGGSLWQGFWNRDQWMTGYTDNVISVQVRLDPTHWAPLAKKPNT